MRWIVLIYAMGAMPPVQAAERIAGEIALSSPSCATFVVHSEGGYALLHKREHYAVLEGDAVRGHLQTLGPQEVEIVGETTLAVTVEGSGLSLADAAATYRQRCEAGRG